ncbi:mitogen-activated protein kinase kinase kinase 3-like [Olea europaea var. sylvestris]|uniref:mitogen-activated protein kinase kinase kinase 3-like n=1 Tax=Olea europaea var. sylvestris TaxID=158386 RepID=UPI000C1D3F0C|nr:mitogen-activated protein kinase kinase kinase 3-like [Olea europaea var. sylvestris]
MPPWWGKKCGKNKEKKPEDSAAIKNEKKRDKDNKNRGEQLRNSPRNSRDFSGFDSTPSSLDRGHPLPTPSSTSNDNNIHGFGFGFGTGSSSDSSVSSFGSFDDHPHTVDHGAFRTNVDNKSSPVLRSPGRGLRHGTNIMTSPHRSRYGVISSDSPTGRSEDGKSEFYRLPLPPTSPTSPFALLSPRSPGVNESSHNSLTKWRKGRLLGRGSFGHVYLGFSSENGQMCAIKEVKVVSDDPTSKESLKQLNQEITLLSQLSHGNIVQYYGSDLNEEALSVYLEYVSGGSIHKLLQEHGSFREPVIQNYTRQILSGLAYLHGRNTVHRDIKGANILVDPKGHIKLADFGMAKHITAYSSMLSFKGSPYWMAPEVVMNMNGYSLAVDIWSLGCTVLEMATSKPPWSQYEGVAAIFKIGNSKDMPVIPDHLSDDAKSFIRLCLQREPSARPTASQLLEHPFVCQNTGRSMNITREPFPHTFDGSRTPTALELRSSRMNNISFDRDDAARTAVSRTLFSPRGDARTMTSLPVSPSSSPLRHNDHKI